MNYDPHDLTRYDDERDQRTWTPRRIIYLFIAILIAVSMLASTIISAWSNTYRAPPPTPPPIVRPGDRI